MPTYVYIIAVVVVLGIGYARYYGWPRSGSSASGSRDGYGVQLPAYLRDHQVPERWYVHGFLAYYTGTGGDPAHTLSRAENAAHLADGWGLRDHAAVDRRVRGYEQGECTLAFDLIRVIKLMRHASGARMVSAEESWRRCVAAAQRLQAAYGTWDDVYSDFQAGRDMWWREVKRSMMPPGEFENYAERYSEAQRFVIQGRPLR